PARRPRASRPASGAASGASGAASGVTGASGAAASSGGARRTLAARFPGTCPCGRGYGKGERITRVGESWGHPDCA
ncbi:ribonuclease HI, partial [Kitasatospora sp. NPDC007106]